ncbi:subtilase family protein [Artemisia annua]|uniref:Subtilase family protein n=1 Tax=Artemisia annua TaxID=35608 RepID=A0A2U1QG98_ARTAN|nr:subtilase family protein [Artemisia annua]
MEQLWLCCLVLAATAILHPCSTAATKQTYIVQINHEHKQQQHLSHLQSLVSSATHEDLLYSYSTVYNGYAASLDPQHAQSLRDSPSVLGVYEDTLYHLHTTRTPQFLGINDETRFFDSKGDQQPICSDVIIGVLDTGVWPELKSFDDSGMPPVPARWHGECEHHKDFDAKKVCNKKLIGARKFYNGYRMAASKIGEFINEKDPSPRDTEGHGTHTSTTAAGGQVANASLFGYASGTARGMAVHARVASYKVCWKLGCFGSDILAAMEKAIQDGVDVLSMSLGGGSGPYHHDIVAVGAFKAIEKGVFVSCSAGNAGPVKSSLANVAPWIMTVGAGTLDRDFPAYALLGNGKKVTGESSYSGKGLGDRPVELVYHSAKRYNTSANLCLPGSLDPELARGKVVLCDRGINPRVEKGVVVKEAGGIGMILANTAASGEELVADSHLLPAIAVGSKVGDEIREYLKAEAKPTTILSFGGTVLGVKPSPVVAAFSSRGPNTVTPEILKPDVIGPGVNILAGWSGASGPSGLKLDTRKTQYNIMSGTSMSCPHISGLAALLKAAHPKWSPSAIKSALMTTAYIMDNTNSSLGDAAGGQLSTPFAHGAGHVDPHKAISPGLVYDISTSEYIAFVCSLNYTMKQVKAIVNRPDVNCTRKFRDPGQLNYPSFSIVFGKSRVVRYTRKLTNVGSAGDVYDVAVEAPEGVVVDVKPKRLVFKNVGDRLRYTVTFVSKKGMNRMRHDGVFGSITWKNVKNQVRSPVAFSWEQNV